MNSKINFIEGDTKKSLISMVLPLLISMILTMVYNLVDSLWVGNLLGESGYAALTNSTAIVLIISAISVGASSGVSILISQAIGAKEKDKAEGTIATSIIISTLFSIFVTIILEVFLNNILTLMNTPTVLFEMAHEYLSIYLIGYTAIFAYMNFTAIFRSYGDPFLQMKGMLVSTILNIVLDPILIHFFSIRGAAIATVVSEVVCLVFAAIYYIKKDVFKLDFKKASTRFIQPILVATIPSSLQSCMPAISSATMLYLITGFGVSTIAAYGVTNKLEILLFYPAMAMNMALTTICGQCMGAKRFDRANDYMKYALIFGCSFIGILTLLVMIFPSQLTGFFIDSIAAKEIVKTFFHIVSIGYIMYMITSCYLGKISGFGKPNISMLLFFIYYIVIRIPLAIFLKGTPLSINGIWVAILTSHILAALLAFIQSKLLEKKIKTTIDMVR